MEEVTKITDTDRLNFLSEKLEGTILGYPSVFWTGPEHKPAWGYASFLFQGRTINDLREKIDYCMVQYELEKQKFKQKHIE